MPTRRQVAAAAAAVAAPPKAATPPPPPPPTTTTTMPLEELVVVLSGKIDLPGTASNSVEGLILSLGGKIAKSVTKKATHVIASRAMYDGASSTCSMAKLKGLPVVSVDWLVEVEKVQDAVDAEKYKWENIKDEEEKEKTQAAATASNGTAANGATTNGAASKTKKRPIAVANPNSSSNTTQPQTKKTKTNGQKSTADADADSDAETKEEKKEKAVVAEGQYIKQKDAVIPLDSYCDLKDYLVYIDDTGMIYDASLNQTNASHNNNKFYIVQLLKHPKNNDHKVWTRWGRVGESGAHAILGKGTLDDAIKNFNKKFRDKSGLSWDDRMDPPKLGKYAFVEKSYDPDSDDDEDDDNDDQPQKDAKGGEVKEEESDEEPAPECTLEKPVQKLMEMIFNQQYFQATMASLNYDAKKLPLGKLGKATILRAFEQLKDLAALLNDPTLAASRWNESLPTAIEHLSNTYYSLIPHDFGRHRPPIIQDSTTMKKEVELLESLSDMKVAADLMKVEKRTKDTIHPLDRRFQGLDLAKMTVLDHASSEFKKLESYLCGTKGTTHNLNYKVLEIFRIEREGERQRFDNSKFSSISSDRRLLWHGSRCTNFGGILSQGLRIAPPEAPVSGYMFGKGIYLADMSSKSANYCSSYLSNNEGLLLLCEAELGDPMQELVNADYDAGTKAQKQGMHTTKGLGRTAPRTWMDAGAVHDSLKGIQMPNPSKPATEEKVKGNDWGLMYNEYICYDVNQVQLRYLFRVKM